MSLTLLRMSAPHDDMTAWQQCVLSLLQRHSQTYINIRLRNLEDRGFLTTHGSPRVGWLTDKGTAALERRQTVAT